MVNFNNDATVSTPAGEVEKISILERRYNILEAIEHWMLKDAQGVDIGEDSCRARAYVLFLQIEPMLLRDKKLQEVKELEKKLETDNWLIGFREMCVFLDMKHITKADTRKLWDRQNVEQSNKAQGL